MKQIAYFFLLSVAILANCTSSKTVDHFNNKKHTIICKTWGFLKYYHPGVGSGKVDWDQKLLEILETSDSIRNIDELNAEISQMIHFCDQQATAREDTAYLSGEFLKEISFSWLMDTSLLSGKNARRLLQIKNEKKAYINYYVSQDPDVGNMQFFNEKPYSETSFPEENIRLLALFRYWNIINYFHPFLDINDKSWDKVLEQYIPRFIEAEHSLDYHMTFLELTANLNDGHTWTQSEPIIMRTGLYGLPFKLNYVENIFVIADYFCDSIGTQYDIIPGDYLLSINNQSIEEILVEKAKYYTKPNLPHFYRQFCYDLFRTPLTDSVYITVERNQEISSVSIKPIPIYDLWQYEDEEKQNEKHYQVFNDSIGYINLKQLDLDEIPDMMDSIMTLPRIIIDIRNYPKGVLYELSKYIHPESTTFAEVFVPDIVKPGSFFWNNTIETGRHNPDYYKGKIILLVNEQTQSHAEFTALCLQSAPNVITIGSTTAGTDGNMSMIPIPGGIETYFSGIGITYPDRSQAQRTGVKIDTVIYPTIEDIKLGRDVVLEVAKEL